MRLRYIYFLLAVFLFTACGEFNKVLKNPNIDERYEYAKKYFNEGKFSRSATLLEDIYTMYKGTSKAEESLYLLAQSYYGMKDYQTASEYFKSYYTNYPKGEYTELTRYYSAYGLYLDSPDPRLDQSDTYKSIEQFQEFMEFYPQSERKEEAQRILFELQEKLALKELLAVRLYYNLGDYVIAYPFPGGNYTSCVITARNAMRAYPYSKYREEFMYYSIRAKYDLAVQSVDDKKSLRYRDVLDEYYTYKNEYPEGKYMKQIQKMFEYSSKEIKDNHL
ncbi:outer membrane protein assembly factor BamD [Bacteroidia bacterium]|nr:outer membrane protein assembly factor BamD [Bacteroidia bacterium]GHV23318.1 outer membrane protein assembly factor BamD [Bacteroidia bacterium]